MQTGENPQDGSEAPRIDPQSLARSVAMTVADEPDQVGQLTRSIEEDDHVTDFRFESKKRGYEGWEWSVTLYHDTDIDEWTVNESSLVPTDQARMPPAWVPWKDRLLPTDLSVTDSIGTEPDDSRLEDGFRRTEPRDTASAQDAALLDAGHADGEQARTQADGDESSMESTPDSPEDAAPVTSSEDLDDAVEEFMLSRRHVLSPLGRDQTAKRWYEGPHGPKALSTKTAAGNLCSTCGFFVPLKGDFDRMFGVCANKWSPDDGRVVSLDHGCGEHSEIDPPEPSHLWVQSKPAYDDVHIDVIAQSPREERGQIELLEEASEADIDDNTVEDDETETEDSGQTQTIPPVESVITMDDLNEAGFPDDDATDRDDDGDGGTDNAAGQTGPAHTEDPDRSEDPAAPAAEEDGGTTDASQADDTAAATDGSSTDGLETSDAADPAVVADAADTAEGDGQSGE